MFNIKKIEIAVGSFLLLAIASLLILALKVSNLSFRSHTQDYNVIAIFDNVGDLRVRAPVSMSGVKIGEIKKIQIDAKTFKALVTLQINENQKTLPADSSASIYTQGLLGSNYISLTPGFDDQHFLKQGAIITNTHSALILENLIGQLLFSLNKPDKS